MPTETPKEIENMSIIKKTMEECWNSHNFSVVDEVFSQELVFHGPSIEFYSLEEFKSLQKSFSNAFTDTKITPTFQFAKEDIVVTHFIWEGTHTGEMQGILPTGKKVEMTGIEIDRLDHGIIMESWEEFDQLGMMKQLGMEVKPMEVAH